MNKDINVKQCTIGWHVDDLKISHIDRKVVESILNKIQDKYSKKTPLTITHGDVHEYLGMVIDFSNKGSVIVSMEQYVKSLIIESPDGLLKGNPVTPAENHLFEINPD